MTLEGVPLVTCVHIYLGADSAQGYLCPPVTVSVSFRFHSLCKAHSPLNCLERNIKWSSCRSLPHSRWSSSLSQNQDQVQTEYRPKQDGSVIKLLRLTLKLRCWHFGTIYTPNINIYFPFGQIQTSCSSFLYVC